MTTPRDLIGTWDGVTKSARLERPYEDRTQMEVPFGGGSFYKAGWRAYMDTQLGIKFKNGIGVMFNSIYDKEIEPTIQLLVESGLTHTRYEIGWGILQYDDETIVGVNALKQAEIKSTLALFKQYGLRPLILLSSYHGGPCPMKLVPTALTVAAAVGDRQIKLDPAKLTGIIVNYTGLSGQSGANAFPLITSLDSTTGIAQLSVPLNIAIPVGAYNLTKLKYQPFSPKYFANGTVNPASDESIAGWAKYVKIVCNLAAAQCGVGGFDVEVWNEMTFGSSFLGIGNYYNPAPTIYQSGSDYMYTSKSGEVVFGYQSLLAMTADIVKDPVTGYPGTKVINGFANQTPFPNGRWIHKGVDGLSRHYYPAYDTTKSQWNGLASDWKYSPNVTVDAQGNTPSSFVPYFTAALPEHNYTFYVTETITNDVVPFPSGFKDHYRFSNFDGIYSEVWQSENNFLTNNYTQTLANQKGISSTDSRLGDLRFHIAAKTFLRMLLFQNHKGLATNIIYNAKETDVSFAVIRTAFFNQLKSDNYVLTDTARVIAGEQLRSLKNAITMFNNSVILENPRKLKVAEVVEYKPRLVFKGDGTDRHPDMYNRDNFVVLPFQITEKKFTIPYYVMTQDTCFKWVGTKDDLDPTAYDMPPQMFDLTLENINPFKAIVSVYDPITNTSVPVTIVSSTANSMKVNLEVTDYPRFLNIEEAAAGPQISGFTLDKTASGGAISFVPNFTGTVDVTWGRYPVRQTSKFKREFWDHYDANWRTKAPTAIDYIDTIDFMDRGGLHPLAKGSQTRITGKIKPKYSEVYNFSMYADTPNVNLYINNVQLLKIGSFDWNNQIALQAGVEYDLLFESTSAYNERNAVSIYWYSDSQEKEPLVSSDTGLPANKVTLNVYKDQTTWYEIAGLRDGDGVKLSYTDGVVRSKFPMWSYDYKGALPSYYADPAVPLAANPVTLLVADDFNRTSTGSGMIGTSSVGGITWKINNADGIFDLGNNGVHLTLSKHTLDFLYTDLNGKTANPSDVDISVKVVKQGNMTGLVFRGLNFSIGHYNMVVKDATTGTYAIWSDFKVIAPTTVVPKDGDVLRIVAKGPSITLYVNGVIVKTITSTANLSNGTCHGFCSHAVGYDLDNVVIHPVL
ncbi:hypothetical protein O9H85_29710 [Paenibacillus filicis]|uniref:PA14 domain-containing protein n=1 Tax=Paenibacillus gyeongsangnamensis TaxID=3388067 RepID=A0ABT4QHZ3_9BACL|nr:hypothetical protein [Paenibacillus filicis]MCZ8516491.1 hypothetical protein [Paenibacillus filicis]